MNLRRIKIQSVYPIPVCGPSRIRSTPNGATITQRGYSGFLPIQAVGNPSLPDASLTKIFLKRLRTTHQSTFFTTSLRTLTLNNGVQPEQSQRSCINCLLIDPVWSATLYLAIERLAKSFPRHFQDSGQSLQQLLQTHQSEIQFVYSMPLMNAMNRNN